MKKLTKSEISSLKYKIRCLKRIDLKDRTSRDIKMIDSWEKQLNLDAKIPQTKPFKDRFKKKGSKPKEAIQKPFKKVSKNKKRKIARGSRETDRALWNESYLAYIKSPAWRKKKEEVFANKGKMCDKCGTYSDVNVYHKSFETAFFESLDDLEVLCKRCNGLKKG